MKSTTYVVSDLRELARKQISETGDIRARVLDTDQIYELDLFAQENADPPHTVSAHPGGLWRIQSEGCWPEVTSFANLMRKELDANNHKGGWKDDSPQALLSRVYEELSELTAELLPEDAYPSNDLQDVADEISEAPTFPDLDLQKIAKEAADVANMLMMLVDVVGGLSAKYTSDTLVSTSESPSYVIKRSDGHYFRCGTWTQSQQEAAKFRDKPLALSFLESLRHGNSRFKIKLYRLRKPKSDRLKSLEQYALQYATDYRASLLRNTHTHRYRNHMIMTTAEVATWLSDFAAFYDSETPKTVATLPGNFAEMIRLAKQWLEKAPWCLPEIFDLHAALLADFLNFLGMKCGVDLAVYARDFDS